MLDKRMYNSWQSRMLLYIKGKKNGRMMLESIENEPLVYPTIEENGAIRSKKYAELTEQEKLQDDCDVQATNIILQGTELSYQERKCKLYNEFYKFTSVKGETLYEYYWRFAQLINDMDTIGMITQQVQLYAYPSQHKGHENEARMLRERYLDPLALVANHQTQSHSAHYLQQLSSIHQTGLALLVFIPGDNPIACLNKAMTFLSTVVALRRQGQSFAGTRSKGNATSSGGNNSTGLARVVKCYNYQGKGHMARQCTKPKRPRNSAWFKTTIPQNAAFQTDDLDAYDFDCDDISSAKVVLMANLSSYDSDVLSEMSDQMSNQVTHWDKVNQETKNVNESLTAELERYKERVKTFEQRLNVDLSSHEKLIDSQMDDMIRNRNALKQEIDSLKQTLYKQVKENESLLQTFNVFKKESKEKENKYMDKEIDLEKKIKELIIFELNEVKTVFNQIEAVVDQCFVDKKYFDIQKKELSLDNDRLLVCIICQDAMNIVMHANSVHVNVLHASLVNDNLEIERLEQENDHLFKLLLSQDIVQICVNSLATRNICREMQQSFIHEYNGNVMLKAELAKKEHMVEKKLFDEVVLRCSRLENHGANLELKSQHQKETKLDEKDISIANLRKHIKSLKGKNVVEKEAIPNNAKFITPRIFKLNLEPLAPKVLKNRDAHIDYIKHSREPADTLREIVKHARALKPLDRDLNSACMWKSTGRTFTIDENTCPLTRITSTKVVPLKETTSKSVITQNLEVKVYSRRPKVTKSVGSSSKYKIIESRISNNSESNQSWGSNASDVPSSSSPVDFRFENDQIAKIMSYGEYQMGNLMISWVYYVEGLGIKRLKLIYVVFRRYDVILSYLYPIESVKDQVLVMASKAIPFKLRLHHYTGQTRTSSRATQIKVLEGSLMFHFPIMTLRAYYEDVGISHQTSVARTPQQNDVVKRRNQTLVEAARTMWIFSKAPLFLWAEAAATACFTQNQSLIRKHHNKTPYKLLHNRKPDLSHLHVFGALCYPTNDSEDLGKLKPKADIGIFVGYAPAKKDF
ncbi:integrase, catalytic region, zinc finger, CCHC-type containing protein [Tanacetum coccineum]|uniref:Integrase, catalytic region, zinc finger, CCHC-type containing protein n=1 Tax=Tanacetum coccineum TaxID=301880 RepID=A0ABQ5EGD7_9ASTR